MSSTNKTTYYELSQYVGTDIINPLTDFNGDNEKIDAALHNIAEAAGTNATDITALSGRVTTAEGKITSLENQNGSDVLVTTAQTLSGAINELKSVNDTQNSTLSAHTSSIDNISARVTTVETKIPEIESDISAIETDVSAIETTLSAKYLLEEDVSLVETYNSGTQKDAINDAMAKFRTYVQGLDDDEYVEISGFKLGRPIYYSDKVEKLINKTSAGADYVFEGVGTIATTNVLSVSKVYIHPTNATLAEHINWSISAGGASFTNLTDTDLTGLQLEIGFELKKFKKVG